MDDLISRQAAIEHLKKRLYETEFNSTAEYPYYQEIADNRVYVWMNEVPSVEPDLSEYSDKLWRTAYERGRAEAQAERKTGRWIPVMHGRGGHCCNRCNGYAPSYMNGDEHLSDFCPYCGAYMGGDTDGDMPD